MKASRVQRLIHVIIRTNLQPWKARLTNCECCSCRGNLDKPFSADEAIAVKTALAM